jgi:hypothetical protein
MKANTMVAIKRKPHDEWTVYSSDKETIFCTDDSGRAWKCAEWCLVDDKTMNYTKYSESGAIEKTFIHKSENMLEIWRKYHTKEAQRI